MLYQFILKQLRHSLAQLRQNLRTILDYFNG